MLKMFMLAGGSEASLDDVAAFEEEVNTFVEQASELEFMVSPSVVIDSGGVVAVVSVQKPKVFHPPMGQPFQGMVDVSRAAYAKALAAADAEGSCSPVLLP